MGVAVIPIIATSLWLFAADIHIAPAKQTVAIGDTVIVDVRLHSDQALVVLDMAVTYGEGLQFERVQSLASDFEFFIQPAWSVDENERVVRWVEGKPKPGLEGHGKRSMRLFFTALSIGSHSIEITDESSNAAYLLGNPPVNGLGQSKSATVEIGPSTATQHFSSLIRENGQFSLLAGPNGGSFVAYQVTDDGTRLELGSTTLAAYQKTTITASGQSGWVHIDGLGLLGGYALNVSQDRQELDLSPFSKQSHELIVPHIALRLEQFDTQLYVTGSTDSDSIWFRGYNFQQDLNISGQQSGITHFNQETYPTGLPPGLSWGYCDDSQYSNSIAGLEQFRKHTARQSVTLPLDHKLSQELTYAHIAKNLGVFWTGLVAVNASEISNQVEFFTYNDQGAQTSQQPFTLDPLEKVTVLFQAGAGSLPETISTPDKGLVIPADTDWVIIKGTRLLAGYVLFGDRSDQFLAGFQSAKEAHREVVFPIVWSDDQSWTGFAVVNRSAETINLETTVFAESGHVLSTTTVQMTARQKKLATDLSFFNGQVLPPESSHISLRQTSGSAALVGFQLIGNLGDRSLLAGMESLSPE